MAKGHLRKRGKVWYGYIYLGNGKYDTKRLSTNEREARRMLNDLMQQKGHSEPTDDDITVAEFLQLWLETYALDSVRRTTFESYEMVVRKHLVPMLGGKKLRSLKPIDLQRYFTAKRQEGLSPTTVRYHHRILKSAFNVGVAWEYLEKNICEAAIPPRKVERDYTTWTAEEAQQFLNSLRGHRMYAFYATALLTGMRRGELLGLKWPNVSFETMSIRVVRSVVSTYNGVIEQEPKSKQSRRSVAIGPVLCQILKEHKDRQDEERKHPDWVEEGWVFPNRRGGKMDPHNISGRQFPRLCELAGVPRIRFHDLRHTHFTELMAAGVHPKIAGDRAGHSSTALTNDVYSHVSVGMQREAAELAERRFLGGALVDEDEN